LLTPVAHIHLREPNAPGI